MTINSASGFFFLVFFLIFSGSTKSQSFELGNPLSITPTLSGNYGELRANHFHAGIDLKTAGREGLEVSSVEEGYVSRIKISPYGYGKAIYIDHPNGYTTVYGHLSELSDSIARYAKRIQYEQESFEIDVYPGKADLNVSKGQVIALSGNTGGSGGPHLHFEIRETATEIPRNPLIFGFPIQDSSYPQIEAIAIEPLSPETEINGQKNTFRTRTTGYQSKTLANNGAIKISGPFGIALKGFDQQNGANNHNGIYKLTYYVDSTLIGTFIADSIAFDKSRYINALIDYDHYYHYSSRFLRLFRIPGNELENINFKGNGILNLPTGEHSVRIIAQDAIGNRSSLLFNVDVQPSNTSNSTPENNVIVPYNAHYFHESEFSKIFIPKGSTYEDLPLLFKEIESSTSCIIEIMKTDYPLHSYFEIMIKPNELLNKNEHWMIAQVGSSGNVIRALSSSWNGEFLRAESKSFGRFKIVKDDREPDVSSINFSSGKTYTSGNIQFRIRDNMSGIESFKALVDGQFVLAEYEYKKDLLYININDLPKSDDLQHLRLLIADLAGNVATFEGTFYHK